MVTVSPPNPESRQVASFLADFDQRLSRIEAGLRTGQLGNSSLDGTGIAMFDSDGNNRGTIGFQNDGTTTVTSRNPQPPPVPSAPQVTPAIACLIVSHTGETQSGSSNPADFSHLNVYAANALSPGERTLRGTINPVPGEFVVSGLDYVSYLIDVTAVNMGGMESAPSPPISGTPQQVVGADIIEGALEELALADGSVTEAKLAANAVTITKIADDSISSPKIIAGSVGAAEIAAGSILAGHIVSRSITADRIIALSLTANEIAANAITAGKITAGAVTASKLEADMVIANRIIAGTPTGARVEMHPTAGIQAFRGDGLRTFWIDASTGSFSAVGSISTAFAGQRIVMNPGGTTPDTIRFYPSSTNRYASIDSITSGTGGAGIMMYGADNSGSNFRGICVAREDYASLVYSEPNNLLGSIISDIFASSDHTRNRSRYVDLMTDLNQGTGDGHIGLMCTNGTTINGNTLLYFNNSFANGGEPFFSCLNRGVGLTFSPSYPGWGASVGLVSANYSSWKDLYCLSVIYAGSLIVASSRDLKRNIEPAQDLDPRQAVRHARAKYFQNNFLDEETSYDLDGDVLDEAKEAPVQLGFIAEEMPNEVTTMVAAPQPGNRDQYLGINRDRLITMLWNGQGDLADRLDQQIKAPKFLPDSSILPDPPATGAMLYVFAGTIYAVLSTGKRVKIG